MRQKDRQVALMNIKSPDSHGRAYYQIDDTVIREARSFAAIRINANKDNPVCGVRPHTRSSREQRDHRLSRHDFS